MSAYVELNTVYVVFHKRYMCGTWAHAVDAVSRVERYLQYCNTRLVDTVPYCTSCVPVSLCPL